MAKHSRSRRVPLIWQTLACRFAIRSSDASPNGVNGFSTLLVDSEQFTPCSTSRFTSATPRRTLYSWSRPIMNSSVAGSTVTATPASAIRRASVRRSAIGMVDSLHICPTATRPPSRYFSVSSQTRWMSISSGELPKSRCMSMSTSNSRARSNTRWICPA